HAFRLFSHLPRPTGSPPFPYTTLFRSRAGGAAAEAPPDLSRLHPSIALAPYIEALVVGRRVAVLGDVSFGLAEALLARGARGGGSEEHTPAFPSLTHPPSPPLPHKHKT